MWMWTLDDRLVNMNLVESVELLEVYPDDADQAQVEAGALEAEYFELVAVLGSGQETLLFDSEDAEQAYLAYDLLAKLLARGSTVDGAPITEPISMFDLLDKERSTHN